MIDTAHEALIPLAEVPGLLPEPVHLETVRRWIRAGRLDALRIGRKFWTSREAVHRFLAACTVDTAPEPVRRRRPRRARRLRPAAAEANDRQTRHVLQRTGII